MRLVVVALLSWLLAGCGLQNIKIYDGPDRPSSEHSTLSSLGVYREIRLALQVVAVNGVPVNTTTAASFYLLPGTHRVTVRARKDMKSESGSRGFAVSFKEATLDAILEAKPGHTYIPAALIQDDTIRLLFRSEERRVGQECRCRRS